MDSCISGFINTSIHYNENEGFVVAAGSYTNYYVATNGSDSNAGTLASPLRTIQAALNKSLSYGDRVLIKGGTYYERLHVNSIGTAHGAGSNSNRLIIGPYGDGPVILNCTDTDHLTWSSYNANIYKTTHNFGYSWRTGDDQPSSSEVGVCGVIMDDNFKSCYPKTSIGALTSEGNWFYDTSAKILYVHTGGDDPVDRDIIVTDWDMDNTEFGILSYNRSFVTIYGLTVLGGPASGIYMIGSYNKVEKCAIKYSGKFAVVTDGAGYANFMIDKCYAYGNVMMNYPRGRKPWGSNGGWSGTLRGGVGGYTRGCICGENGGEGIFANTVMNDNISFNNYSVNYYICNYPNVDIYNNVSLCTGINTALIENPDLMPSGTTVTNVARRLTPLGISPGDEILSSGSICSNIKIYNNVVIGCRRGIEHYCEDRASGSAWINFTVTHNLIILPNYDETTYSDYFYGINFGYGSTDNISTSVKNNIIIGVRTSGTRRGALISGTTTNLTNITLDNNCYYHPGWTTPFHSSGTYRNFTDWKAYTGKDASSLNTDPLLARSDFLSSQSNITWANLALQTSSPCIGAGDIGLLYGYIPIANGPDIGPYPIDETPPISLPTTVDVVSAYEIVWCQTNDSAIPAFNILTLEGITQRIYYRTTSDDTAWSDAAYLTTSRLDNYLQLVYTDRLLAFWHRIEVSISQLRWDEDLAAEIDISQYVEQITIEKTDELSSNKAVVTVSDPSGLFDPLNYSSLLSKYLEENNIIKIEKGNNGYYTPVFFGYIGRGESTYTRGEQVLYRIDCLDRSKNLYKKKITSVFYEGQIVSNIINSIIENHTDLLPSEHDTLPLITTIIPTVQFIDEYVMDILTKLYQPFNYFPYFNESGELVAKSYNYGAAINFTYYQDETDTVAANKAPAMNIVSFDYEWSDDNIINQVTVIGETPTALETEFPEEFMGVIQGSAGWYSKSSTFTFYFSQDKTLYCTEPRLNVTDSCGNKFFGGGESLSAAGAGKQLSCNINQHVSELIAALYILVAAALLCSVLFGGGFFAVAIWNPLAAVVAMAVTILGQVGSYYYEIYARPVGEAVPDTIIAIANDSDSQAKYGIIPLEIDNPFLSTYADCLSLANKELEKALWFRYVVTIKILGNPAFEIGDVIYVYNPHTGYSYRIYVSDISHDYKRGERDVDTIKGGLVR